MLGVYAAVGVERTRDDPRYSHSSSRFDVPDHRIDFTARIDEVASSRPNQDEHRYVRPLSDGRDQRSPRSSAACVKIDAQLDPVGSRTLGGESALEALDRGFDECQTSTGLAASVSLSISRMAHS